MFWFWSLRNLLLFYRCCMFFNKQSCLINNQQFVVFSILCSISLIFLFYAICHSTYNPNNFLFILVWSEAIRNKAPCPMIKFTGGIQTQDQKACIRKSTSVFKGSLITTGKKWRKKYLKIEIWLTKYLSATTFVRKNAIQS